MSRDLDTGQLGPTTPVVFVASENLLAAFSSRACSPGEVLTFTDADVLNALQAILRRRPQVVVLEQVFASTARGKAFVDRLRTDPSLASLEIRVLSTERTAALISSPRYASTGAVSVAALAQPLQSGPIRRARRVRMPDGTEMIIDGHPVALVDLSALGAQVISPTILRPNQHVRLSLPEERGLVRACAEVAWAALELPRKMAYYRAGLEFNEAHPQALETFLQLGNAPEKG